MSTRLPYISQPTAINKVISKIKEAQTPDRFTTDFLQTKLRCNGGNYRSFIPLAKKLALLNSDGSPTELYKQLRNPTTSKAAMAAAIKVGYKELFERNEHADNLSKENLKGLIVEITGLASDNRVVQLTSQTIEILKALADFDVPVKLAETNGDRGSVLEADHLEKQVHTGQQGPVPRLGLSYIINLVLPKTDDPAVFNAIFRSLRDNLLRS